MSSEMDVAAACRTIRAEYSACDISDALLKLQIPQAGFLPDILPIPPVPRCPSTPPTPDRPGPKAPRHVVAPISTVLFASKASPPSSPPANIPDGSHWTDLPGPGTIAVLKQPDGQACAVCGDILATRLQVRGLQGIVADGRVRDLPALGALCCPVDRAGEEGQGTFTVWSKGSSTVGTGLEAKAWAVDVPVAVQGVEVRPGDILCADEGERGCVVIPRARLGEVMEMLPGLKAADDKCVEDVKMGVDVQEAFRRHR